MNSFKAIARAIEGERERQIELLSEGKPVIQETRRWDDNKEASRAMRSKEDAKDYRYFPDPDLPPVFISEEWLKRIRDGLPEFRTEKMERYRREYGVPEYDISILTQSRTMAELFERASALCGQPKKVSNWADGRDHAAAKGERRRAGGPAVFPGASGGADRHDRPQRDQRERGEEDF